jgi:hypothetical protein
MHSAQCIAGVGCIDVNALAMTFNRRQYGVRIEEGEAEGLESEHPQEAEVRLVSADQPQCGQHGKQGKADAGGQDAA